MTWSAASISSTRNSLMSVLDASSESGVDGTDMSIAGIADLGRDGAPSERTGGASQVKNMERCCWPCGRIGK